MTLRPVTLRSMLPLLALGACVPTAKDSLPDESATGDTGTGLTDDTGGGPASTTLYVGTTDYEVGALASVNLDDGALSDGLITIPPDHAIASSGGKLFVMGRSSENTVRVYGEDLLVPEAEFATGDATNPQDATICGGSYVVALYAAAELAVYSTTGARTGSVDLSAWADEDGSPEASGLYAAPDGFLYVTLNQLGSDYRSADGSGTLLKVDCSDWTVAGSWDVSPNASLIADPLEPDVLTILGGNYYLPDYSGPELDGAVYRFDTRIGALSEALYTEADVGANIGFFAARGESGLLVTDDGYTWAIRCTTPDASITLDGNMFVAGALLTPDGQVWMSVRPGFGAGDPVSGLYRIDMSDCSMDGSIQTSLPPGALAWR